MFNADVYFAQFSTVKEVEQELAQINCNAQNAVMAGERTQVILLQHAALNRKWELTGKAARISLVTTR